MSSIEELEKLDSTFTESGFKAKVDNMYIMLLSSIIDGNLNPVRHKISDEVYNKYNDLIKELNNNNEIQLYDELNVKSTYIDSVEITDDKYIVNVTLISRYMPYRIDKITKEYKSGVNDHRIEINNHLVLTKRRDAKEVGLIVKCSYCGAPVDVNRNGICTFCKNPYDTKSYDWVLESIK